MKMKQPWLTMSGLRRTSSVLRVLGYCTVFGVFAAIACLASSAALRAQQPHVLMISIDGMKPEYVTQAAQHHLKLPVLERFLSQGTYAEGVTGVVPTVTYPSHTTLVTGVWPAEHGIVANTTFDPFFEHPGEWYWYFRALKAETLYQAADKAGLKTAAVGWPVTVGAPIDYLIAEMGQSEKTDIPKGDLVSPVNLKDKIGVKVSSSADGDEKKTEWAIGIINTYNPNFVLLHLTNLDHQEHGHGPFSAEANDTIELLDRLVGKAMDAELAKNPDAKIVIVSDHGFVGTDRRVALNVLFAKAGLLKLVPNAGKGERQIASWDAQVWESGGSAVVVLRDPKDAAVTAKVKKLLAVIASSPEYGVNKVVGHDQILAHGGNPQAAFLIDFKPGWAASGAIRGAAIKEKPGTGTHGYLPEHPELRSAFMTMGKGVAQGRNLGVIDMRQIAPTVAEMLGVKLPQAPLAPVQYGQK